MNLQISDHHFVVTGCNSGFGMAIAEALCREGALVTGIGRRQDPLARLHHLWPEQFTPLQGDLLNSQTLDRLEAMIAGRPLHGLVLNAGGPPAMKALETRTDDWDKAYQLVFRWKIDLVLRMTPALRDSGYGRILFIESQSVKQPHPLLVLSNSMRAAIAGFAKSLSADLASTGVSVNLIGPGPHDTPAIERVIAYRAEKQGESMDQARAAMEAAVPVGRFGKAEELASLALWLLSPLSSFVTGQTISHDGGTISGLFG